MTGSGSPSSLIKSLANNSDRNSLATRMRRARFALFLELLGRLPGHVEILDIGGTQEFWSLMLPGDPGDIRVTLLNLEHQRVSSRHFVSASGDARAMPQFADRSFDVVFSNSVIEHVGSYVEQAKMAAEIRRVGKRYFVQTPNKRFPLEPHFLFPWFQYLPAAIRGGMLQRFNVGWYQRIPDAAAARAEVDSIQLLTRRRFVSLFPGAALHVERFAGLAKSFTVFDGWN